MKILSYGATGSQGFPVAQGLLQKGHTVNVVVRHPERAGALRAMGAQVFAGDLSDPASLAAAHQGVEAVFLMLPFGGGDPVAFMHNALEAARAAGVRYIVFNVSGQTPPEPTGLPMLDYRIAVEGMLRSSGIPHVVLRPTAYMENFLGPWTQPGIVERGVVAYPVSAHRPLSWVASADVGAVAVATLERPDLAGSVLDVGGPEALTGGQVADSFSRALGRLIRYEAISPEAFGKIIGQVMGPEAEAGVTAAYRASEAAPLDAMVVDMDAVYARLPVTPTTLEDWVRRHAAAFRAEANVTTG